MCILSHQLVMCWFISLMACWHVLMCAGVTDTTHRLTRPSLNKSGCKRENIVRKSLCALAGVAEGGRVRRWGAKETFTTSTLGR